MKITRLTVIILITAVAAGTSSCIMNLLCINGNGIIDTEERESPAFTRILNTTSAEIILTTGEETGILIETDINLLQYYRTSVSGNRLEIETRGANCIRPSSKTIIYITAAETHSISVTGSGDFLADTLTGEETDILSTGSGDIFLDYVEGDDININITGSGDVVVYDSQSDNVETRLSGSGDLTVNGISASGNFTLTGSGNCYASDLYLYTANILITGSGDAYTDVSNELIATITGSGDIYYRGNPHIYSNISGSGRLIPVNK